MARNPRTPVTEMWQYIVDHPGVRVGDFMRQFGYSPKHTDVNCVLTRLENQGYLISENDNCLWPFAAITYDGMVELQQSLGVYKNKVR